MNVLFFDTETTGIKSDRDPDFVPQLVQLGAILYNEELARVLAELNVIVYKRNTQVPPVAEAIHGISTEMVHEHGVSIDVVTLMFLQLAGRADRLVAHNADYDVDVINDNMPLGKDIMDNADVYCTMRNARDIVQAPFSDKQVQYFLTHPYKQDGKYKLPSLLETYRHFFGREFAGAHDAMADVRACMEVYYKLKEVQETTK